MKQGKSKFIRVSPMGVTVIVDNGDLVSVRDMTVHDFIQYCYRRHL